jgi:hypothetical protein
MKNKDDKLKKYLRGEFSNADEIVIADGLSDAFIGIINTIDGPVCAYDKMKVIILLKEQNKWDYFEAEEYADFNIFSAYVKNGPLFVDIIDIKEWDKPKKKSS